MAGCSYEYNGYTNYQALALDLVTLMVGNGFLLMNPSPSTGITAQTHAFTLEAGPTVDPLNLATTVGSLSVPAQPWRIRIDASDAISPTDPGNIRIYVGTPIQLPDDGSITVEYPGQYTTGSSGDFPRYSGEITCGYYSSLSGTPIDNNFANTLSVPFAGKHWSRISQYQDELIGYTPTVKNADGEYQATDSQISYKGSDTDARPFSFRLTISDHGLAICVWEEGQDLWGNRFSWLVVQRPVDQATGATLVATTKQSRCPVFCVYSVGGGEPDTTKQPVVTDTPVKSASEWAATTYGIATKIFRFTVREIDVNHPSIPIFATIDTPNSKAVMDGKEQVSITENNQYVISFMSGFTTERYLYKQELDMITYCSADVIGANTDITITPYTPSGAPEQVTYKAMMANLPDNAGMRILMLVNGQGVSGNCTPLSSPNNLEAYTSLTNITHPV